MQKERYIQVSKVDEEERKRREQQKLEREQVSFRWILNEKVCHFLGLVVRSVMNGGKHKFVFHFEELKDGLVCNYIS